MRLPAVRAPNPLDARVTDAGRLGQRAGAPVRCSERLLMQGHVNHLLDHRCRKGRFASATRRVPLQPGKSTRHIASLPTVHCPLAFAHRPNDRHLAGSSRRHQYNPRSPDQLLRRITVRHPTLKRRPIFRRQPHACLRLHTRRLAPFYRFGNPLLEGCESASMKTQACMWLSPEDRATLEGWVADRNTPQKLVWRSRIVLMSAAGAGKMAIVRALGKCKRTVDPSQSRYLTPPLAPLNP